MHCITPCWGEQRRNIMRLVPRPYLTTAVNKLYKLNILGMYWLYSSLIRISCIHIHMWFKCSHNHADTAHSCECASTYSVNMCTRRWSWRFIHFSLSPTECSSQTPNHLVGSSVHLKSHLHISALHTSILWKHIYFLFACVWNSSHRWEHFAKHLQWNRCSHICECLLFLTLFISFNW